MVTDDAPLEQCPLHSRTNPLTKCQPRGFEEGKYATAMRMCEVQGRAGRRFECNVSSGLPMEQNPGTIENVGEKVGHGSGGMISLRAA